MKRDENGASLIIALLFVLIFSVALAIMMDFENLSFKVTRVVRDERGQQFAAEGAIEADVQVIRSQPVAAFADVSCPPALVLTGASAVNGVGVRVECAPTTQQTYGTWGTTRQRDLTFTACPAAEPTCVTIWAKGNVVISDFPATGSTATDVAWAILR